MVLKTELKTIKDFIKFNLNKSIVNEEEKRLLFGTYQEYGSDELYTGDEFEAYEIQCCNAFQTYECYIAYFNHTIQSFNEKQRIAVKAVWSDEK